MLLYFGENDSGGLLNNFTIKFKTWSVLAKLFGLHPFQVIRVLSERINRFTERGTLEWPAGTGDYAADCYQFFRIMKLKRTSNLVLEVEAQLYARYGFQQFKKIGARADAGTRDSMNPTPPPILPAPGTDNPAGQRSQNPGPAPTIIQLTTSGPGAAFKLE
jgi:hypothetical protein